MINIGPVETLARLALQSERYQDDVDYRDAVDAVLGHPVYNVGPQLLAACKAAVQTGSLIEDYTHIRAAIAAAEGKQP